MIATIVNEISNMTLSSALNMAIFIAFAWFISKFAKNTIPRLLWIGVGLYLIISSAMVSEQILYDIDTILGIGFILPHINFFFRWLHDIYLDIKQASIDTYVLFLTIYYKIRNFFLWFFDTYKKIHTFFTKSKYKDKSQNKRYQQDYYQEQQKQYYSEHEHQGQKFYDRAKQRREQREQEQESYSFEEDSTQQEEPSNDEQAYQEFYEEYKEKQDQSQAQKDIPLEEQLKNDPRYTHLFSDSPYIVIGVSADDDFKTMKKAYSSS